jgi:uncharacterized DUF497 family protein
MEHRFEWNDEKARSNFNKHEVDFQEASTIFDDLMLISFLDEEHSTDEERYITIGLSNKQRLLMVAHTERGNKIRIISARKATQNEENFYAEAG